LDEQSKDADASVDAEYAEDTIRLPFGVGAICVYLVAAFTCAIHIYWDGHLCVFTRNTYAKNNVARTRAMEVAPTACAAEELSFVEMYSL